MGADKRQEVAHLKTLENSGTFQDLSALASKEKALRAVTALMGWVQSS